MSAQAHPAHPAQAAAAAPAGTAAGAATAVYDVLVVGAGINGAGIARDLAGRGLTVLLVEQDDIARHTSSASTKLIHGGLRYLEYYEFGLVRKALAEREVLLKSAPHIMWPLRFVMPHDRRLPGQRPVWMIRAGLFLYDHLARREWLPASTTLRLREHPAGAPLKPGFVHGFAYSDGWVDDARLVLLNVIDAAARGATVHTRTRCESVQRRGDRWVATLRPHGAGLAATTDPTHPAGPAEAADAAGGVSATVEARLVVNASGPWAGEFLKSRANAAGAKQLRLVKGSHIVVPKMFDHDHAYIFQNPDGRIVFAIPYEGEYTLIGTTDVEVDHAPDAARIDADEIAYLCQQASAYFAKPVTPADVVWSYSGVRPLVDDGSGSASSITRDYLLEFDDGPAVPGGRSGRRGDGAPMLTVWGGKLTTFRKLSEEAADLVARRLGNSRPAWTEGVPFPGGDLSAWIGAPTRPDQDFARFADAVQRRWPQLPAAVAQRWARAYGSRVDRLWPAGREGELASLGAEVAPGLYEAELDYLWREEWARSADDVLWRRSKLGVHFNAAQREAVARWWAARHRQAGAEMAAALTA